MGRVALPNSLANTTLLGCGCGITPTGRYGGKSADLRGCTREGA